MFEQTFKNIDDILYKDAGADSELDYIGQTSWILFLKYLDDLEKDRMDEAELKGETYNYILAPEFRWESWAMPKGSDGSQITAKEFLESLFGQLPSLFKNEDELRTIWSKPDTRKKLLLQLEERGFAKPQLQEFQKVLSAENSDLYDVLAYIAFESQMIDRGIRAEYARETITGLTDKQQEFINFVLGQYVKEGVEELDMDKLTELLELKYMQIADAKKELGSIANIRDSFVSFQPMLYDRAIRI